LLPEEVPLRRGASGRPLPLVELRIGTARGEASAGEIGDIEIRGPNVFAGYLDDAETRGPDDWFATGDVGYLDDDGYLYVADRRDDLIISGGENIYPAEIEGVLRSHPCVNDAGVISEPHDTWGARPIAFVVWRGDAADADSQLRRHCAARLASYKIPDRFVLTEELPRSASGKLLRRELSKRLAASPTPATANSERGC
jgi:O-succinylbenzoic acid--CoA ligase